MLLSHAAVCMVVPLKSCRPGMLGTVGMDRGPEGHTDTETSTNVTGHTSGWVDSSNRSTEMLFV